MKPAVITLPILIGCFLLGLALSCWAGGNDGKDFSTPERALAALENAYRARDLDAAVAAKDFNLEAKLLLQILNKELADNDEILRSTAKTLELAFRKELQTQGFPAFDSLTCHVAKTTPAGTDLVKLTEVCTAPDGRNSSQNILVGKSARGWKVLIPVE